MIFGKYINRYYLKHAPALLLGLAALLMVDYIQLIIPQLYRLVINGMNLGQVVVNGETLPFTKEVLLQHICLPMIWIVVLMVIGRFLWRVCFFGSAVRVTAEQAALMISPDEAGSGAGSVISGSRVQPASSSAALNRMICSFFMSVGIYSLFLSSSNSVSSMPLSGFSLSMSDMSVTA